MSVRVEVVARFARAPVVALLSAVLAGVGCGTGEKSESTSSTSTAPTSTAPSSPSIPPASGARPKPQDSSPQADLTFAQLILEQLRRQIQLADAGASEASAPELRKIARAIRDSQLARFDRIQTRRDQLRRQGVEPAPLGLDFDDLSRTTRTDLERDFDRGLLDALIEQHEVSLRLARAELRRGSDRVLRRLARQMINRLSAQLDDLRSYRGREFGDAPAPPPAAPPAPGPGSGPRDIPDAGDDGRARPEPET